MSGLFIWIIGWVLFSIIWFIYSVYVSKDTTVNKKVHAWRAFWAGILSWVGIILAISLVIAWILILTFDIIEDKLNSI